MKIILPFAIVLLGFIMSSCKTDTDQDEKSLVDKKIDTKISEIVESMPELTFPDTTINLIEYAGFEPDGEGSKNFQPALNKAIEELSAAGGGTVYLSHSSGDSDLWVKETEVYRMDGPINLKSNIRLLLDYGTKIQFTYDPENYLVDGEGVITRWEGVSIKSFSPLIRAFNAENIAIEAADGHGAMPVIDGDGEKWGLWSFENDREREYKKVLHRLSDTDVKLAHREFVDINKDYYRPFLMEFYLCKNVRIEGLELRNTPFWTVHFLFSEYARARNLVFNVHGENSDGVDPESSHNVLIENCHFNNHDDNVAIKSGRNKEGREGVDITGTELEGIESKFIKDDKIYGSTENIVVRNNVLKGHHAICIGSEVAGSVRNVFVNDNTGVQSVRYGLFIKSSPKRGGVVEDIYVRDLKLEKASLGIVLNPSYAELDTVSSHYPLFRNIYMKDVEIEQARKGAIQILGWPELPIENVHLEGITIKEVLNRNQEDWTMVRNARDVTLNSVEVEDQVFDGDFSDRSGEIPVPTE